MNQIDTGSDHLLAHIDDRVGVAAFNRPERRNALSPEIYEGLTAALDEFERNDDVRVVMLTGAGSAFCAGGDVKGMNERNKAGTALPHDERVADLRRRQRETSLRMHEFAKPVVAALPGPAAGAGFSLAMAADVRIAARRAFLMTAFANVGGSGDFGGSWFLTRLVGEARAKDLYFRSPRITAEEALRMGLVNEVLDDDGFETAAVQWCQDLAMRAPLALAAAKQNINRASLVDLAAALDAEAEAMATTMSSADHREAAAAFVEKRTPVFKGE